MVEQDGRLSAQVAVLGSLLIQPELVGQALEKIRPEDFLTPKCRMVFQAIKSLYTEGRPTDPVTVRGRLGGKDGDSWTEYLLELMDLTPTAANVWEYAALMREQARMAKVAELGSLLQAARDLDGARGYIAQLNELLVERRGVQRMDMAQMLLTFTDRHSGTPVEYMTWGLPKIDAGTYAEMGDMVVLGGYPSAGKTALAVSMAYHQAKDRRVGFYSLETNQYKLADRLMANLAGIEMPTIKRNEITGEQWQRWPTGLTESGPGSWSSLRPAVCRPRTSRQTPWLTGTRSCTSTTCSSSSRRPGRSTVPSRCPGSAGASSSWPTAPAVWWWLCPSSPGRSTPAKTSRWSPPCPTCGSLARSSRTRT